MFYQLFVFSIAVLPHSPVWKNVQREQYTGMPFFLLLSDFLLFENNFKKMSMMNHIEVYQIFFSMIHHLLRPR